LAIKGVNNIMFHARTLTKVAALSSLIFGTVASSAMAIPVRQAITQKSQSTTLLAQSVDEDSKIKFEARGCYRTKSNSVTCDVLVTNLASTPQELKFSGSVNVPSLITNAIDASGTVYGANLARSGTQESTTRGAFYTSTNFVPNIPTKVSFIFEIPKEVTALSALDVGYSGYSLVPSTYKRIALTNIGAIASKLKSPSTATPRK
jgi:hypothetical protein